MISSDTLLSKSLALFSFDSFGKALTALNLVGDQNSLEVLECLSRGQGGDLLVVGEMLQLQRLENDGLSKLSPKSYYIEAPDRRLLKALLNLENANIDSGLLIFESLLLGEALLLAQDLLQLGWQIVDFKVPRSGQASVVLIATAGPELLASMKSAPLQNSGGTATLIAKVSVELRSFFDLSPKA